MTTTAKLAAILCATALSACAAAPSQSPPPPGFHAEMRATAREWRALDAELRAFATAHPRPAIVFVGGFLDGSHRLLKSWSRYFELYASEVVYTGWSPSGLSATIADLRARRGAVMAIGHSYGGSTLANVASLGAEIDLLILIDPVGARAPGDGSAPKHMAAVASHTGVWTVVAADNADWRLIDKIAVVGQEWADTPLGFADILIASTLGHADVVGETMRRIERAFEDAPR